MDGAVCFIFDGREDKREDGRGRVSPKSRKAAGGSRGGCLVKRVEIREKIKEDLIWRDEQGDCRGNTSQINHLIA